MQATTGENHETVAAVEVVALDEELVRLGHGDGGLATRGCSSVVVEGLLINGEEDRGSVDGEGSTGAIGH